MNLFGIRCFAIAACLALSSCTIVKQGHHGQPDDSDAGRTASGTPDGGSPQPMGAAGSTGRDGTSSGTSGDDSLSALDNTMPEYATAKPRSVVRVSLILDASGKVSASSIERLQTSRRVVPIVSPQYLVVAYAGDKVVSAAAVRFAKVVGTSTFEDDGTLVTEDVPVNVSSATVFLDADDSVDRITLFDGAGAEITLHTGEVATVAATPTTSMKSGAAAFAPGVGIVRQADTSDLCFEVVGPGNLGGIDGDPLAVTDPMGHVDHGQVVTPTDNQLAAFQKTLLSLPPALASSVARVAFVEWPAGTWAVDHRGGMHQLGTIFWNVDLRSERVAETLAHETTHAFAEEMDRSANGGDTSNWPALGVQMAREAVSRVMLASGLTETWQSLHATGVQAGVASDYVGKDWRSLTNDQARPMGFASRYGASSPVEDIAEYAGTTFSPGFERPGICPAFTGLSELDLKTSIPYAKLVLLRAVGAVSATAFDGCVGKVRIGGGPPGVYFKDSLSFVGNAKHSTDTDNGLYEVISEGDNSYIFDMKLSLPNGPATNGYTPSPLGLHRLNEVGSLLFAPGTADSIFIYHSNPFRARTSAGGLVLVLEDTLQHTQGVLFGIDFESPTGSITDHVAYGTYTY